MKIEIIWGLYSQRDIEDLREVFVELIKIKYGNPSIPTSDPKFSSSRVRLASFVFAQL